MAKGNPRFVGKMRRILEKVGLGRAWFEGRYMLQQKERYPQENVYEKKGRMLRGLEADVLGWTKTPNPALCP